MKPVGGDPTRTRERAGNAAKTGDTAVQLGAILFQGNGRLLAASVRSLIASVIYGHQRDHVASPPPGGASGDVADRRTRQRTTGQQPRTIVVTYHGYGQGADVEHCGAGRVYAVRPGSHRPGRTIGQPWISAFPAMPNGR